MVCALKIKEATSFLVREGGVFIPDRGDGMDVDRRGAQLIDLNRLISVTAWVES